MPTTFLHGEAILAELSTHNGGNGSKDLAVAYWGSDAIARLGLGKHLGNVRVICDPWGGFCDASSLKGLLDAGARIRTIPAFHAKTYLYPETVIVGSANASAMGLGDEEIGPRRMESAVVTDDPEVVSEARAWFKIAWSKGKVFTPGMLPAVAELCRRRKQIEHKALPSLLHAIADEQELFKGMDVRVHVYKGETTEEADAAWNAIAATRYSADDLAMYEQRGETPFYEDVEANMGDYEPGVIYLDYHCGPRGGMTYGGIWQVKEEPIVKVEGTGNIIGLLDLLPSLAGRKDTKGGMAALGRELELPLGAEERSWPVGHKDIVAAARRALKA